MTDGQKKYALAYAAKLEALRVRDFARVQLEEEYMRKIRSSYGISHEDARKIQDQVEGKTMQSNPRANPDGDVPETMSDSTGVGILAVGVLALIGGVIYVATRPDAPGGSATGGGGGGTLPAPPTAPPTKPKCLNCAVSPTGDMTEAESFAKATGYNIWCVENQAVATWEPATQKPAYTSDPKARAYSQIDCSFYTWSAGTWIKDDIMNGELQAWRSKFIGTSGHPMSTFVVGA